MMVGRPVQLEVQKEEAKPTDVILEIKDMCVASPETGQGHDSPDNNRIHYNSLI